MDSDHPASILKFEPEISVASTPAEYAVFAGLIAQYVAWLRIRHADEPEFVDLVFGHQSLDAELRNLADAYGPPNGWTFLARRGGEVYGAGALRRSGVDSCEMKRLFVPDRFRGHGVGRGLCDAIVAHARCEGFRSIRLDTVDLLREAITLYTAMGFRRCAPFHDYPPPIAERLVFLEMPLA